LLQITTKYIDKNETISLIYINQYNTTTYEQYIKSTNQPVHIINVNTLQHDVYNRHDDKPKYVFMFLYLTHQNTSIEHYFTTFKYKPYWDRNVKLIIIIDGCNDLNVVLSSLKILWKYTKLLNSVVMLINENEFNFYTWSPYDSCLHNDSLQVVNVWKDGQFLYNTTLFPDKLKKTFRCTNVEVMFTSVPPMCAVGDVRYKHCGDGFEATAIKTIAHHYNMSVVFKSYKEKDNIWLLRSESGEITGGIGKLYRHESDLLVAAVFLSPDRSTYAQELYPVVTDDIVILLPKHRKMSVKVMLENYG
jgi:hypothetical protein